MTQVCSTHYVQVYQTGYPADAVYRFTRTLVELPLFERDVLPSLLKYCQANMASSTPAMKESTVTFITDLILAKCPLPRNGEDIDSLETYMLDFGTWYALFTWNLKPD